MIRIDLNPAMRDDIVCHKIFVWSNFGNEQQRILLFEVKSDT